MSHFVGDLIREIRLDRWIEDQGGLVSPTPLSSMQRKSFSHLMQENIDAASTATGGVEVLPEDS